MTVDDTVEAVTAIFGAVFSRIESWRSRIEQLIAEANGSVATAEVDALAGSLVATELDVPGAIVIGAGFVAAPRFLSDRDWHLAWWLGASNTFGLAGATPGIRRLEAVEDESSESFRDYTNLEWWRVPVRTGEAHITGPYVDYLCTDDYTLTLTMPVRHGGALVGVVGADIYVTDIERMLLPRLRDLGGLATVVNSSGRVVVSTDPHRAPGTLVRLDGVESFACGDAGLRLVVNAA